METFVARYPEIVNNAKDVALEAIRKQREVVQLASKKVQELRELDRTSPYTSIGSNAGQAEIAYNIENARLNYEVQQPELIDQWADAYMEYIKTHMSIIKCPSLGTVEPHGTYNCNSFETFADVCAAVNSDHIINLITGHKFECKCQFFDNYIEKPLPNDHFYIGGYICCLRGTKVHLTGIKSAIKRIGLIGIVDPDKLNIYPIPNKYED